jgi:hypothetical protein
MFYILILEISNITKFSFFVSFLFVSFHFISFDFVSFLLFSFLLFSFLFFLHGQARFLHICNYYKLKSIQIQYKLIKA